MGTMGTDEYALVVDNYVQVWRIVNLTMGVIAIAWVLTRMAKTWDEIPMQTRFMSEAFVFMMITVELAVFEVFLQNAVGGFRMVAVTVAFGFVLVGMTMDAVHRRREQRTVLPRH